MKILIVKLAQWLIYKLSDRSYKGPTFTSYRLGAPDSRLPIRSAKGSKQETTAAERLAAKKAKIKSLWLPGNNYAPGEYVDMDASKQYQQHIFNKGSNK